MLLTRLACFHMNGDMLFFSQNLGEIPTARLTLIPVPNRKNNVRFVIYAKNFPY